MELHVIRNAAVRRPPGRLRTACTVMLDTLATPAAMVMQLYGLDKVPGPTMGISKRAETLKEQHPCIGHIAEVASWSVIGFDLVFLAAQLSRSLGGISRMLSDIVAYTAIMVHPSIVSAVIQKVRGVKSAPGVSEYYQACSIPDLAATPLSLSMLSGIIHSGASSTISTAKAITAVAVFSIVDFTIWAIGFVPYWAKVIRKEQGIKFAKGIKSTFKGIFHPFKKEKSDNTYEEAGRMVGIGASAWAVPVFTMRIVVAAFLIPTGIASTAFNEMFFATVNGFLGVVRYICSGIKTAIVKRLLKGYDEDR